LQDIDTTNTYTVLLLQKDKDYWKPRGKNFSVIVADYPQYSFAEQLGFKKLLDSLSPDLVHFMMPQQPVLYTGLRVTTIHDLTLLKTYNSDKNWLMYRAKQCVGWFVFKHVVRSSAYIITDTEYTKKELGEFSTRSLAKTSVILLAADTVLSAVEPYDSPYAQYILYVGQQSDYKNIRRLASAHQRLIKKHPGLGLILVGRKNASALQNEDYFTRKQYKNILFTDFVPDSQRDWLYKNTAAYVFPSLMEGFGLPGLEAMGYGAPVVSSNATCLPEVYGDAAHYFDPNSTTDMARAIDDVLTDKNLRSGLIKKGYKQLKKYSWKRTAEQTHAVYVDVLRGGR